MNDFEVDLILSDQTQPVQPLLPEMPPTPRDFANPSMSELIPFTSKKINILRSGILIPAAVTAGVCTMMWSVTNFVMTMNIIGGYLLFMTFFAVYAYSGISTPFYIYIVPCVLVYYQIETSIFSIYAYVFRVLLPGGDVAAGAGFISRFISMFFGAGLCEELLKATPALLGLLVARRAASGKPIQLPVINQFKVTSPIEGMIMGLAAGAMFIFLETLFEYVPKTMREAGGGLGGIATGFWLLFPRTLQGLTGHMGWAAISGYFIGMAARYPKQAIKLVLIGILIPSLLHGFWNSSSALGPVGRWLSSGLSLLFFVGCMLKAKQLDAMQNGRPFVSTVSILAGTPMPLVVPAPVNEKDATSWGGLTHLLSALLPNSGAIPAAAMPTVSPMPSPVMAAQRADVAPTLADPQPTAAAAAPPSVNAPPVSLLPVSPPRFTLANGKARFGIVAGQTIDLSVLFPSVGLPPGSLAEVLVNPKDPTAIGLKNNTSFDWTATTATGAQATVVKGRNLKLVDGETIVIGPAKIIVQAV